MKFQLNMSHKTLHWAYLIQRTGGPCLRLSDEPAISFYNAVKRITWALRLVSRFSTEEFPETEHLNFCF